MWFWYSITSAVLFAVTVVLSKRVVKTVDPVVATWTLFSLNIPLLAIFAILVGGVPDTTPKFYLGAVGSALFFSVAKTLQLVAFKVGTLSKITPLATFGTVFTYLFGLLFLSENVTPLAFAGLILVVVGAYILNSAEIGSKLLKPFQLLFSERASYIFLVAILITSVSAVFGKLAVTNTFPTRPVYALVFEHVIITMVLLIFMQWRGVPWSRPVRNNLRELLILSTTYGAASLLAFTSFATAPVSLVYGVNQLQLFFILLMSYVMFKDRPSKQSILATIIMVLGVILIRVA